MGRVGRWIAGFGARRRFYGWALALAGVALVSPFQMGVVLGDSMSPTLHTGQVYVLNRAAGEPVERGDVVVFNHDGETYIKRVLALGGDTVYLFRVEGAEEDMLVPQWELPRLKRLLQRPHWRDSLRLVRQRIPQGFFFAVGDHLESSMDSRTYGPVPLDAIRGTVSGIFTPTDAFRAAAVELAPGAS
jgi:signal peptidase I